MTSELEIKKHVDTDGKGKFEPRLVFVSHSHADRDLASALKTLVDTVFSGVVKAFISSDPGPTGGIMPGDQWYSQVEGNLRQAEAVWVLATPTSISRPWIYWEAGTGRALCPRGVVVLRVGVGAAEVPSPLNNFQSYDGLRTSEVGELVGKVGTQIGLTLAPILIDTCAKSWVDVAEQHEPLVQDEAGQVPTLTPERLDRLDAAIARLEAVSVPSAAARRARTEAQRARAAMGDMTRHILPGSTMIDDDLEHFVQVIERAPSETTFEVPAIDSDGDAIIRPTRDGDTLTVFLHSSQLELVVDREDVSDRTRRLLAEIARVRDEAESVINLGRDE